MRVWAKMKLTGSLLAFALIAAAPAPASAATKTPSCGGKPATVIVKGRSGRGTVNDDVIVVTNRKGASVRGLAGNDLICGGPGRDRLDGGPGDDRLDGLARADRLTGGPGRDQFRRRAGDRVRDLMAGDAVNGRRQANTAKLRPGATELPAREVAAVSGDPAGRRTVTLSRNARAPKVGSVMVSGPGAGAPQGVLGRVAKVSGRSVTLKPASLQDAYAQLRVSGNVALDRLDDSASARVSAAKVQWVGSCDARLVKNGVTNPDAEPAGTDTTFGPGPQASMEMNDLRLNWDYDLYGRMLSVMLTGSPTINFSAGFQGKGKCEFRPRKGLFIPVYGPLGFELHPFVKIEISGRVGGTLKWTPRVALGFMTSALYGSQAFTTVGNRDNVVLVPSFNGSVTIYSGTDATASVAGVVGIGSSIGPEVQLTENGNLESASVGANVCFDVHARPRQQYTVKADVIWKDWRFSLPPFPIPKIKVWEKCINKKTPTHNPSEGGGGGSTDGSGPGDGSTPGDGDGGQPGARAKTVDMGVFHTCAVRENGFIDCWGRNERGELGNGSAELMSATPIRVSSLSDAVQVSAGYELTCAVRANGAVMCWGDGRSGQLGNPEFGAFQPFSNIPVDVYGIDDAVQVSAGDDRHACAVRHGGTVACWGRNAEGQLGSGALTTRQPTPVEVTGLSDAVQVSAGSTGTCAVRANGTVACWGSDFFGELGDGPDADPDHIREVPVAVLGLTGAVSVSVGTFAACALRANGTVACWGAESYGSGGGPGRTAPVNIDGISDARSLSVGRYNVCALRASGRAVCWGPMVGPDHGAYSLTNAGAMSLSKGGFSGCAIHGSGRLSCWGENRYGQLGIGTASEGYLPLTSVIGFA